MRFGHFDDDKLEYVITRPDTPLPWINYLGSEAYFGIISNTAGGYSFYKDARLRRITRYRYNNAPLDVGGRYIYIRDDQSTDPDYWSPSWQPIRKPLEDYECRHGLGYTKIKSLHNGIEAETCYFVPLGENIEVWELTVTNRRSGNADLSIFSSVEFCLWDALDDTFNFQRNYSIGEVEVVDDVIYHKSEYRERRNHFAFFACSHPLAGFDTQRDDFLGPYRGWDAPLAVEQGKTRRSIALGWQPIGALHTRIKLQAGETKKVIFLLGYHENPSDDKFDPTGSQQINKKSVKPVIERYLQPVTVNKAFSDLKSYWDGLLSKFQVDTPDIHTNRMVNIWNAYQMMITFNFSRSASYFESGVGRGMGFRDSTQDLLGFTHLIPERARERLLDLAATQLPNGGAYHQYQPLTKLGNNDIGSGFNDDPLWLVLAVSTYLKETGDWTILDEPVPFDNQAGSEAPLLNHLERSMKYTTEHVGPHGLPLIGQADWNDCLNLNCFSDTPGQSFQTTKGRDGKVAESVFIAGLYVLASKEMEAITQFIGKSGDKDNYAALRNKMEASIESSGWDGDWFRRAYDNDSQPIGSKDCDEGRIFIEPQGMCIMAGVGLENGMAEKSLASVRKHLAGEHGISLLYPAYKRYYLNLGEISSYPPGYKENGSVFCHTNPWVMIAETCLNRGDDALDYYHRINPSVREEISEIHRCEPYVYAQTISGNEAVKQGEAKNSWLTGTASWNYVAITQHILGIRPTLEGLMIAPVIPEKWKGFKATRTFRGVTYEINVQRKGSGNTARLEVDGRTLDGNLIPLPAEGARSVKVQVTLG
ncbi:MAG: glycosyl transferase [Anaerolineaceae bacterium]|nr:glycosyl transferase [Anaerolineaceae bacterium]MBN2677009.1 glycosyl transferase [Anaerolineaceae bacterium]